MPNTYWPPYLRYLSDLADTLTEFYLRHQKDGTELEVLRVGVAIYGDPTNFAVLWDEDSRSYMVQLEATDG
jgi:hypothetical protein